MAAPAFRFKKFSVDQQEAAHPVGTDGVLLGAWAPVVSADEILDIGTGTGLIALMLAQRNATARITAIDIYPPAVACAARNFENSPWSDRLLAQEASFQTFSVSTGRRFDVIVSNPPFFTEQIHSPAPERRLGRAAVHLSGEDLVHGVLRLLRLDGRFCVVLPLTSAQTMCELGAVAGLFCTEWVDVHARPTKPVERVLLCFERHPERFKRSRLYIYETGNHYSAEFRSLTKDYYLD